MMPLIALQAQAVDARGNVGASSIVTVTAQ
jgi:hypothetical protein